MSDDCISVVVRFHDCARLYELERALISLMMQSYKNVEVVLITQRFTAEQTRLVRALVDRLRQIDATFTVNTHNFSQVRPLDARSALLNLGIEKAQGRYLAFLDYDDTMQTHAYQQLIDVIRATSVAIAFGGIAVKFVTLENDFCLLRFRGETYMKPLGLAEFLHDNHCPIHSFVVDRSVVRSELMCFEDSVQRAEDYQFLLRICAEYPADFSLKTQSIGDYYFKDDGSNTVVTTEAHPEDSTETWRHAAHAIASERKSIMLAPSIQKSLGVHSQAAPLSVTDYLRMIGQIDDLVESQSKSTALADISISQSTTGLPARSAGHTS